MNWQELIERIENEARDVLKEHGHPCKANALIKLQPESLLLNAAKLIVLNTHLLRKMISLNQIERALGYQANIFCAYEDMYLLRDVPTLKKWIQLEKDSWSINKALMRAMDRGLKSRNGARSGGNEKRSRPELIKKWGKEANNFRAKNPKASTHSVARHVAKKCGGKVRTITRYI